MNRKSQLVAGMGLGIQVLAEMVRQAKEQGVSEEELHVLGTADGVSHLRALIAGLKPPKEAPKPKVYLRQLYAGEKIAIGPTDGIRTIARAGEVFSAGIGSDFTNWGLDVPAPATESADAAVYEQIADGTFERSVGSMNRPLDRLCHTQHQIIDFCVRHRDKLCRDGYGTSFLFKVGGGYFVAHVNVHSGGRLDANVNRFSYVGVWRAEYPHRFVFPQLEPSAA